MTFNCHFSKYKKTNQNGGVKKLFLLLIVNFITNSLNNFPFGWLRGLMSLTAFSVWNGENMKESYPLMQQIT